MDARRSPHTNSSRIRDTGARVPTVVLLEGVGRRYQIGTDVVDAMQDIDLEIDGASSPSCSVRRGAGSRRC